MRATPPPAMSCFMPWLFEPGVVRAITFQQVDAAPHAEAGAQSNHEGLQDFDCAIEKFHGDLLLTIKSLWPVGYTPEISFFTAANRSEG